MQDAPETVLLRPTGMTDSRPTATYARVSDRHDTNPTAKPSNPKQAETITLRATYNENVMRSTNDTTRQINAYMHLMVVTLGIIALLVIGMLLYLTI